MENHKQTNRLAQEKSPYLLQHAQNPVDWYPWGPEAFEKARREDKPVFLSIGYSTCHWCHVMEEESFEDNEVAALLNGGYVAIKVDREERPDIDAVYMAACQAMTGRGGWPLTVLMTPEQKPFWTGTYLPKHSRSGAQGLIELLLRARAMWEEDRARIIEAGDAVAAALSQLGGAERGRPGEELIHQAADELRRGFDDLNGGFGAAPKFPMPHNLLFLLRFAHMQGDRDALYMAERTLTQMLRGGIMDHIGGGFSRYSVDDRWLVPHFEKMLYDNALMAYAYLEAYDDTGNEQYKQVAAETLDYVLRELTGPDGEFYCGQDADSDGVEGKYYTFTQKEIHEILGERDAEEYCRRFDITEQGSFEGKSIPNLLRCKAWEEESAEMRAARKSLYDYRLARTQLHTDDKVLTAWNALMITAMAKGYRTLGDARYLRAARRARAFIAERLTDDEGRLFLRWRAGQKASKGQLDDYAFLTWALIELYETTFDTQYLRDAERAALWMYELFLREEGGFYMTPADGESLISRPCEWHDGAMPSGNSVAALALVKLSNLTGERAWMQRAERQMSDAAGAMAHYPSGYCFSLLAMMEFLAPPRHVVCCLSEGMPEGLKPLLFRYRTQAVVKTTGNAEELGLLLPMTRNYAVPESGESYYVCEAGRCRAPVRHLEGLEGLLREKRDAI